LHAEAAVDRHGPVDGGFVSFGAGHDFDEGQQVHGVEGVPDDEALGAGEGLGEHRWFEA